MGRVIFIGAGAPSGPPAADVYDLNLAAGATAADLATAGFAFARTGTAWDAAYASVAGNVPVITSGRGLFVEEARTNSFLQSNAVVTRTITGLSTATAHLAWIAGTGSLALSGGATGTVTAGAPLVFTPTGTSVTFTKSGTVTFAALEADASYPILPVVTTTGAVTRAAESCPQTVAAVTEGTVAIRARTPQGVRTGIISALWVLDAGSTATRIRLSRGHQRNLLLTVDSGGVNQLSATVGTINDNTDFTAVLGFADGAWRLKTSLLADVTSAIAVPAGLTVERLGSSSGPQAHWNSSIARVARWGTRLTDAQMGLVLADF